MKKKVYFLDKRDYHKIQPFCSEIDKLTEKIEDEVLHYLGNGVPPKIVKCLGKIKHQTAKISEELNILITDNTYKSNYFTI